MLDVKPKAKIDLLEGASAIAAYLYGDETKRRKVYHLHETTAAPFFKLGDSKRAPLCALRSSLSAWIEAREQAAQSSRQGPKARRIEQ